MGTRADFYVGRGDAAEWLGSVAMDGYEWQEDPACPLMTAESEEEYRAAVQIIAGDRDDFISPAEGWPWPWENSYLTDRVYAWFDGKTTCWPFYPEPGDGEEEQADVDERASFPNMSSRRSPKGIPLGGPKSGLLVLG